MAQGKFNDFGWHSEWHTARKKEYSQTCIYLNYRRECQNRDSYYYLSKCFDSSHCPWKEKDTIVLSENQTTTLGPKRSDIEIVLKASEQVKFNPVVQANTKNFNSTPKVRQRAPAATIETTASSQDVRVEVGDRVLLQEPTTKEILQITLTNKSIETSRVDRYCLGLQQGDKIYVKCKPFFIVQIKKGKRPQVSANSLKESLSNEIQSPQNSLTESIIQVDTYIESAAEKRRKRVMSDSVLSSQNGLHKLSKKVEKMPNSWVQITDSVILEQQADNHRIEIFMNNEPDSSQPLLHKKVLGRKRNDSIEFQGQFYEIIQINKNKTSPHKTIELISGKAIVGSLNNAKTSPQQKATNTRPAASAKVTPSISLADEMLVISPAYQKTKQIEADLSQQVQEAKEAYHIALSEDAPMAVFMEKLKALKHLEALHEHAQKNLDKAQVVFNQACEMKKKELERMKIENPSLFALEKQKILEEQARLAEKRKQKDQKYIETVKQENDNVAMIEHKDSFVHTKKNVQRELPPNSNKWMKIADKLERMEELKRKKQLRLQQKEALDQKYEEIKRDVYYAKQKFKEDPHAIDPWIKELEQAERTYQQSVSNGESDDSQIAARREVKFWKNVVKYISKPQTVRDVSDSTN